jgi:hypothetical protein
MEPRYFITFKSGVTLIDLCGCRLGGRNILSSLMEREVKYLLDCDGSSRSISDEHSSWLNREGKLSSD